MAIVGSTQSGENRKQIYLRRSGTLQSRTLTDGDMGREGEEVVERGCELQSM